MTSLYHNPFLYHDPTIINVHTLLKPQTYQQATYTNNQISPHLHHQPQIHTPPSQPNQYISSSIPYINTHIPPATTYPNFIANNSHHYLPLNFAIEELHRSQRACLHSISKFASELSTLNNSLTPPNFTYQQQPFITSTTVFNHNFNQHSHDPFPPPKSYTKQPPITTCIDQRLQHLPDPLSLTTVFAPLNSDPSQKGKDEIVQPHEVVAGNNFFPSFNSNSPVTADEKKLVNDINVDIVKEPTHFDVVGESIFTVSKTVERSKDYVVIVKNQEEVHQVSSPIPKSQPPSTHWFAGATSDKTTTPAKYQLITTTSTPPSLEKTVSSTVVVAEPFPQHLFIFDSSVDERQVRSLVVISSNGARVFDPGGKNCADSGSPALLTVNNHGTYSPLQLPWDRGKNGIRSFLCPASDLSSISSTTPSLLWLPCDRGKLGVCSFLFSATILLVRGAASGWPWMCDRGKKSCTEAVFALQSCNPDAFSVIVCLGLMNGLYCLKTHWASKLLKEGEGQSAQLLLNF